MNHTSHLRSRRKSVRKHLLGSVAAFALLVAAACSGGSSNAPTVPYPAPSGIGSGALSSKSATSISLAPASGLGSGSVALLGSGSVTVTQSATNPTGTKVLQVKTLKAATAQASSQNSPIAYITLTASSAVTLSSISGVNVTPATTPPAGPYYLAYWNGTQWVTIGNAGKAANGIITFGSVTLSPAVSLASGANFYVAVYGGSVITTPPPAPIASPSALTVPMGTTQTFNVTSGTGVAITATSQNTSVATVAIESPQPSSPPNPPGVTTFIVTPVGIGSTTIKLVDAYGQVGTPVAVTVNNTFPSPKPSAGSNIFSLNSTPTIQVSTKSGTTVRAQVTSSTPSGVLTSVPASVVADSLGHANFQVTASAPGSATITFTDQANDTVTFAVTVSNVQNGGFANGLANWTNCSYAHTPQTVAVNESSPVPVNPLPTQSPGATTAAITPSSNLSSVVAPPANDNPSPPAGVGPTAPPAVGSNVALLGSLDTSVVNVPKGEFGICQQVAVSAATPWLTFWAWMGGENYSFKTADQEAMVLDSTGTNVLKQLLLEQHCYIHPPAQSPGITSPSTNGCFPAAYGGDSNNYKDWAGGGYWQQFGPFNLSQYANSTITLYFGNWSWYANNSNTYSNFWYLGSVEMMPTNALPALSPLDARRTPYVVQLGHR